MAYSAKEYAKKFKLKVKNQQTKYYKVSKKREARLNSIESDTSFSGNEGPNFNKLDK